MPIDNYFDIAFAQDGPLAAVPDATQPDGSVSYTQGYGVNYTLQPGTPGALDVENTKMNQILNDITTAIQNYQQNGIPPFITSTMNGGTPFSYAQYAQVLYNGVAYQSNTAGNTDTPPSSKWNPIVQSSPNQFVAGVSTGSANTQVLATLSPLVGFSTSINGQSITFTAGFTNTAATTLAITSPSVSAVTIKKVSGGSLVNLSGGEIVATASIFVTYNMSQNCFVLNTGPSLGSISSLNIGNNIANDTNGNAVATIPPLTSTTANLAFVIGQWGSLVLRSNAGSAMADTLPGISGALPAGWYAYVQNTDITANDTIGVGGGGVINTGNATGSIIALPGDTWLVSSAGVGVYYAHLISRTAAATVATSISGNLPTSISGNNTSASITVSSGLASDSTNSILLRGMGYSWLASNGNAINGTDASSSTLANSMTYHMFLCSGISGTGTFCSASMSPTFPAGYTAYHRRIFSFNTDGAGAPIPYVPVETEGGSITAWLANQVLDINGSSLGTSRVFYTLTVPTGIKVTPFYRTNAQSGTALVIFTSGDESDVAPSSGAANWTTAPGGDMIEATGSNIAGCSLPRDGVLTTNTSGQIGMRATSISNIYLVTRGFKDFRR